MGWRRKGESKNTQSLSLNITYEDTENSNTLNKNSNNIKKVSKNTLSFDDLQKHLKKDNINVRWSGTKFSPKDLLLYRVNTKTLKTSGEIFYKRIVTTKFESSQKIEIRTEPQQRQTVFESPVYFEELKNQINTLKQRLKNITNHINDVNAKHDALQNKHNVLRNDHNTLRNEYNALNSWTRNDFWKHVQGIFRHVDNIWLRTFPSGYDDNVKATFKSRWGVIL